MHLRYTIRTLFALIAAAAPPVAIPAAAVGTPCLLAGCVKQGPSRVAQGLKYHSGNAEYDRFFDQLFQVQVTMGDALEREKRIRARLARAVGAVEEASPKLLAKTLDEKLSKLSAKGIGVRLAIEGTEEDSNADPSVDVTTTGGPLDKKTSELVEAIERAARDSAELLVSVRGAKAETQELQETASALEPGIDVAFRKEGPFKKSEVRDNLTDAQRLLPLIVRRANQVAGDADEMLDRLDEAASTASPAPAPPEEADAGAEKGSPAAPGPKPARPAPKPSRPSAPSQPAEPPPPADDFEP